jgi:glycosyltransferase involved in cell wall biosynthesis
MRCPTLAELPPPPPGKSGWPWTVETLQLAEIMPDGKPWPGISIVTPSFDQGRFIEETIRSVLLQGYPNLEYIIIDGGSSDNSVEIIKKYQPWLKYWISESDRGQAHAINKGFEYATGEIGAYINSDDFYLNSVFSHLAETFSKKRWDVFVGRRIYYDRETIVIRTYRPKLRFLRRSWWIYKTSMFTDPYILRRFRMGFPQECVFWEKDRVNNLRFDESYQFCMDVVWFFNIFSGARVTLSSMATGVYRNHECTKGNTMTDVWQKERERFWNNENVVKACDEIDVAFYRRIVRKFRLFSVMFYLKTKVLKENICLFSYVHPTYRR